jgi:putative addiction module CopG family antidote
MQISLSAELRRFVSRQVEEGQYRSEEAVVQAALRWFSSKESLLSSIQADPARSTWHVLGLEEGTDIEALAFLVMMEAAKGADEDLKSIMASVKAITAAKSILRDMLSMVKRDISANLGQRDGKPPLDLARGMGSPRAYHRARMPHPDPESPGSVKFVTIDLYAGRLDHISQLETVRDELNDKLDSMSEMGEMMWLRLQMQMDRRSRMFQTLSNILKKMSDTQSCLIQNLK